MKSLVSASIFVMILLLTSCKPYQMDIPQGKTLTDLELSQIKPGISKDSVIQILGTPLQGISPYDANRIDYVTSMQKNGGIIHEKLLSIYFKNNVVTEISRKNYIVKS